MRPGGRGQIRCQWAFKYVNFHTVGCLRSMNIQFVGQIRKAGYMSRISGRFAPCAATPVPDGRRCVEQLKDRVLSIVSCEHRPSRYLLGYPHG